MNSRLILLIHEYWPARPSAPWVLLDPAGRTLSEGESEPRHWPPAAETVVVLAGSQCAWHQARLPRGARREESRLLAYALEDRLLRDADSQHLTVTRRAPGEDGLQASVLVVSRERIRHVIAQLAAIGRPPIALHAELECVPSSPGRWHLALTATSVMLRSGAHEAQYLDPPLATAAPLIAHALATARAANRAPETLELHLAAGVGAPAAAELAAFGCEVRLAAPYAWWTVAGAANLLHGEFAPRHARASWLGRLRWPLRVAGASLVTLLLANLGEVLWQRQQLAELESRMARLFESAVPNTPAIAPAAQLRRQLDEARMRLGRLREDDALALLAAYGDARGTAARDSLESLIYREGRLELELGALEEGEREVLRERLAAAGLRVRTEDDPPRLILAAEVTR